MKIRYDEEISKFEKKYDMLFAKFKKDWKQGKIEEKFSYSVEKYFLEWEALETLRALHD